MDAKTDVKCGPENCPLTAWAALSPSERKIQRKSLAERLYAQGFTMEQIAEQFGVTHKTISNDLENCTEGTNQKRAKTATNPKGSGRPKKARKQHDAARDRVRPVVEAGGRVSRKKLAKELGVGENTVQRAEEYEKGRLETFAQLLDAAAAEHFTDKGTLRIDDAIRVHKARLDRQFEHRVRDEVHKRIEAANDATRANNKELREENMRLWQTIQRGKIFTPDQYKAIIRCLHPDSNPSPEIRHKAFLIFEPKKFALTGEK